ASVDFNTGKSTGPTVRPIQSFIGTNRWLDWSRDGKYLAYVSERGRNGGERVIAIRAIDTGEVTREFVPKLQYFQGLSWAPDGVSFATGGTDLKGRAGVFRIDAQNGDVAPIVISATSDSGFFGGFRPEWSPDGTR